MELILDQTATLLKVIEKLEGNIEGLIQTLEDKDLYAARKYYEWLLGEGKKKQKEDFKEVLMRALNTLALGESEEYKDMARAYLAEVFQSLDRPQGIVPTESA